MSAFPRYVRRRGDARLGGWNTDARCLEPALHLGRASGVVVGPPAIDHIIDRMQHGWTYVRI